MHLQGCQACMCTYALAFSQSIEPITRCNIQYRAHNMHFRDRRCTACVFTYALSGYRVSANTTRWKGHECNVSSHCIQQKLLWTRRECNIFFTLHMHEFAASLGGIVSHSKAQIFISSVAIPIELETR